MFLSHGLGLLVAHHGDLEATRGHGDGVSLFPPLASLAAFQSLWFLRRLRALGRLGA